MCFFIRMCACFGGFVCLIGAYGNGIGEGKGIRMENREC